jgi:hypothetical protein
VPVDELERRRIDQVVEQLTAPVVVDADALLHLTSVLTEYTARYNDHRPRRSLGQRPPNLPTQVVGLNAARVQRRPILGGLINEYTQAA